MLAMEVRARSSRSPVTSRPRRACGWPEDPTFSFAIRSAMDDRMAGTAWNRGAEPVADPAPTGWWQRAVHWSEEASDECSAQLGHGLGRRVHRGRSVRRLFLHSSAARARAA